MMTPETYKEVMEKLTERDKDLLSKVLRDDWSRWEPPAETKGVPLLISSGTIYARKWGAVPSWRVWIRLDGGDFVLAGLEAGRFFPLRMMYDRAVIVMMADEVEPIPPEVLYEDFLRDAPPGEVVDAFLARKQQTLLNKMGGAVRLRGVPSRKLGQVWRTPSGTEFKLVAMDDAENTWVGRDAAGLDTYASEKEFDAGYYVFVGISDVRRDPIRWEDYLPKTVTPKGLVDCETIEAGQIYASCWMDGDYARIWRVTLDGDLVLAGMSKDGVFGNRFTSHKFAHLKYDTAVLIADVDQPPRVFVGGAPTASVDGNAQGYVKPATDVRPVDVNSRYPAINPVPAPVPFVDARRAALEREIADAEAVPTCIGCGARGPIGKSRMCFGCWGQSRGATEAVLKKPERFVVDVCDEDLLPPA